MNIILFEPGEAGSPLPIRDPRAVHILRVLGRREGDRFDAGIVNGPAGKGLLVKVGARALEILLEANRPPAPADPVHLLLAVPRPQTARKILNEAASMGVASMRFFNPEKGERSYASSTLWSGGEWRRHLVEGAAQAFDTRIPELTMHASLGEAIGAVPAGCAGIALDNYEAAARLGAGHAERPIALAFGAERGWSSAERALLRESGFGIAHLGPRVLRMETAVVAALALVKSG